MEPVWKGDPWPEDHCHQDRDQPIHCAQDLEGEWTKMLPQEHGAITVRPTQV